MKYFNIIFNDQKMKTSESFLTFDDHISPTVNFNNSGIFAGVKFNIHYMIIHEFVPNFVLP